MDAQAWWIAGTVPLVLGGGLHALATLVDTVRPTYFTPVEPAVRPAVEGTGIRLRAMVPGGDAARPSMWDAWLGFNLGHGLGVLLFGLLCLVIGAQDFALVERIDALRPLAVAFGAAYLAVALRFWFWGPILITGSATLCFAVATALSA